MKSFKLSVDANYAEVILSSTMENEVTNISPINMGELSKVFAFDVNGESFVAHFRESKESLEKGAYIYSKYCALLPIPEVITIGEADGLYFSISRKAAGKPIMHFKDHDQHRILTDLAKWFTVLGEIDVESSATFGWISPQGNASLPSWKATMIDFFREDEGFHKDWTKLYEESFLERDVFEEGYVTMMELLELAPDKPQLVHGDFHLGNMLSDGVKVTGIVDWEMAMYGDFMLDLAGLHFWSPHLQFPQKIREQMETKGKEIPHFDERLRCYMIFKAIDGLRFYAKKDDQPSYEYMKAKLRELLSTN